MKYAAVVLFNNQNPLSSVNYGPVTDGLLAGGVFLDEITFLPYDAPSRVAETLQRLSLLCDGVFLICDRVLLASAREAIEEVSGKKFSEEYLLDTSDCLFAALPAEESETVRTLVVPRVDRRRGKRYGRFVLRLVAVPGDRLAKAMRAAEEVAQGKLALHASGRFGETRLEALYDSETPKMTADEVLRVLVTELNDYTYALEDVSLAQRLSDTLRLHRMKLSTCESFTAGGVGQAIVSVPGASDVFYEGLNTYSNESKRERLGVSEYTLKSKGAVSDQTAYEMAAGLIAQGKCDLSVATTGIAGPDSDGTGAPVGLCYIAVGTKERVRVFRYNLEGDRQTVTKTAVNLALFLAYREIK